MVVPSICIIQRLMHSDKAYSHLTFLFNYFPFHNCHTPYFQKIAYQASGILLWGIASQCKKPRGKQKDKKIHNRQLSKDNEDRVKQGLWLKSLCLIFLRTVTEKAVPEIHVNTFT